MDLNDIRSLVTFLGFALFLALAAWTWWPTRRSGMNDAAQLPFSGDVEPDDATREGRA